ncbi:hypothetical protein Xvtw_06620 [Xanthomonas campestris pv. vitiswoodrowii]|nr:hypothetical protein Xvtw_06620 [Xanthomonas campestris pv. vitiswoodrowii]
MALRADTLDGESGLTAWLNRMHQNDCSKVTDLGRPLAEVMVYPGLGDVCDNANYVALRDSHCGIQYLG